MKIVLYDIPSKGRDVCWSPNTWKARVALNFKGLAYESEFVEMPQIAPKLKELGVAPNESGTPYTLPTVGFGDETIMDSKNIAQKLQEIQPEPPLYLDASFASEVDDIIMKIIFAIAPVLMSLVPRNLLNQESADYIINVHQRYFGMSLDEIEKTRGGERAWEAMEQEFKSLIDLLKREPGPFFLGKTRE
ncbi:MAG: hypothetical protein M1831_004601 [Alyxoria varia]|nr:MAG: hypothetical protein M1831_004601 [Alyxoria varia]